MHGLETTLDIAEEWTPWRSYGNCLCHTIHTRELCQPRTKFIQVTSMARKFDVGKLTDSTLQLFLLPIIEATHSSWQEVAIGSQVSTIFFCPGKNTCPLKSMPLHHHTVLGQPLDSSVESTVLDRWVSPRTFRSLIPNTSFAH